MEEHTFTILISVISDGDTEFYINARVDFL